MKKRVRRRSGDGIPVSAHDDMWILRPRPRKEPHAQAQFTETQIVGILKGLKAGKKAAVICREHGISEATLHNWRSKYGGLEARDLMKHKHFEGENRRLKKIVADQVLNIEALPTLFAYASLGAIFSMNAPAS